MLLQLSLPDSNSSKHIPYSKLEKILELKKGKYSIDNLSLSDNIYYINLDDYHLLLMHKTPENENVLNNYDNIEYNGSQADTGILYWLNFTNGNYKNLGVSEPGKPILLDKKKNIQSNYYELESYTNSNNHLMYEPIILSDNKITVCCWIDGIHSDLGLKDYDKSWKKGLTYANFAINVASPEPDEHLDISDLVFETNRKYFIVFQYDGDNKKVHFYRKSDIDDDYRETITTIDHSSYWVGSPMWSFFGSHRSSTEKLYDLKIYNKILTSHEISALFHLGHNYKETHDIRFKKNDGTDHNLQEAYSGNGDFASLDEAHCAVYECGTTPFMADLNIRNPDYTKLVVANSDKNRLCSSNISYEQVNQNVLVLLHRIQTGGSTILGNVLGDFSGIDGYSDSFYGSGYNGYILTDYVNGVDEYEWYKINKKFKFRLNYPGIYQLELIRVHTGYDIIPDRVGNFSLSNLYEESVLYPDWVSGDEQKWETNITKSNIAQRIFTVSSEFIAENKELSLVYNYDPDLLYWFNFIYASKYGMGSKNKGVSVRHSGRINSGGYYLVYWDPHTDIQFVELPDLYFTEIFWTKMSGLNFKIGLYRGGKGIRINAQNSQIEINGALNSETFTLPSNFVTNSIYFLVLQYDGTNGKIYLYRKTIDGVVDEYETFTVTDKEDLNSVIFYPHIPSIYGTKQSNVFLYDIKLYNKIVKSETLDDLFQQGYDNAVFQSRFWFKLTLLMPIYGIPENITVSNKIPLFSQTLAYKFPNKNEWVKLSDNVIFSDINMSSDGKYLVGVGPGNQIFYWDSNLDRWNYLPSSHELTQISIADRDTIWAIGANSKFYKWTGHDFIWTAKQNGAGTHISVGSDGTVLHCNSSKNVYQLKNKNTWSSVASNFYGIFVGDIDNIWGRSGSNQVYYFNRDNTFTNFGGYVYYLSVTNDGNVWSVTTTNSLSVKTGTGFDEWTSVSSTGDYSKVTHSIDDSIVITLKTNGEVWGAKFPNIIPEFSSSLASYFQTGVWTKLPSTKLFSDISISSDGKYLLGIDNTDGDILYWDLNKNEWIKLIAPNLIQLSVGNRDYICGVDGDNNIYKWDGKQWFSISAGKATHISVNTAGTVGRIAENQNIAHQDYSENSDTWTLYGHSGHIAFTVSVSDNDVWVLGVENDVHRAINNNTSFTNYTNSGSIQYLCGLDNKFYYINNSSDVFVYPNFTNKGSGASKITCSELVDGNYILVMIKTNGEIWGMLD